MRNDRENRSGTLNILFIGDIVGKPGREAIGEYLQDVRKEFDISMVVGNAENAAGGIGLTPQVIEDLLDAGLDVITSGNHIWRKKEVIGELDLRPNVIRPANYPEGSPGSGSCLYTVGKITVGVLNLCGRVFMAAIDCPFRTGDRHVKSLRKTTPVIIVDMHAEATSEKEAMGTYLDGKVSAVIGTHTHVQTSDARILPGGTAYITDAGMTGPSESVLGVKKEIIIKRFLTQRPERFEVAKKYPKMECVVVFIDPKTGLSKGIQSLRYGGTPQGARSSGTTG